MMLFPALPGVLRGVLRGDPGSSPPRRDGSRGGRARPLRASLRGRALDRFAPARPGRPRASRLAGPRFGLVKNKFSRSDFQAVGVVPSAAHREPTFQAGRPKPKTRAPNGVQTSGRSMRGNSLKDEQKAETIRYSWQCVRTSAQNYEAYS